MGQFLHSTLVTAEALTASAVRTDDLPVNPLSAIFISLAWRDGAAVGNTANPVRDALSFLSRIDVLFKGQAILSGSAADLMYAMYFLTGYRPSLINQVDAAAEQHWLTFLLSLGRRPWLPDECFPAVRKGELQLQIATAAAVGTVDTPTLHVETLELLGATPKQFVKGTVITKTPSATGEHDVDLPIGNPILGISMFSTTTPTGTSSNASIGQVQVKRDNVEYGYSRTYWRNLRNYTAMRREKLLAIDRHFHNQAANTDVVTGWPVFDNNDAEKYAYLDFDPVMDGQFLLETENHARVHLRINQEPTADAIRLIPFELVAVTARGAPGA